MFSLLEIIVVVGISSYTKPPETGLLLLFYSVIRCREPFCLFACALLRPDMTMAASSRKFHTHTYVEECLLFAPFLALLPSVILLNRTTWFPSTFCTLINYLYFLNIHCILYYRPPHWSRGQFYLTSDHKAPADGT